MHNSADWSNIIEGRKRAKGLPGVLNLPKVDTLIDALGKVLKKGDALLDFGANDRNLKSALERAGIDVKYSSVDIDRNLPHDYYEISAIERTFDAIVATEVVEHMPVMRVVEFMGAASRLLNRGGHIVITTPNVCHPVVFWRDCTHITPLRYDEVYGLLHSSGFEDIKVFRLGKFKLKQQIVAFLYSPLLKLLRMDYMPGILAIARKR